jgi:hypothetical protein
MPKSCGDLQQRATPADIDVDFGMSAMRKQISSSSAAAQPG